MSADAQKELSCFQHRVAKANKLAYLSRHTTQPPIKMSDVRVVAMNGRFLENVAGNREYGFLLGLTGIYDLILKNSRNNVNYRKVFTSHKQSL